MMDSIAVRRALQCMALLLAACGGRSLPPSLPTASLDDLTPATSPIKHVVVMIQENRTFNDFFATYPGADGTTTAQVVAAPNCSPPINAGPITLKESNLDV